MTGVFKSCGEAAFLAVGNLCTRHPFHLFRLATTSFRMEKNSRSVARHHSEFVVTNEWLETETFIYERVSREE
jgi:hypothetical protein